MATRNRLSTKNRKPETIEPIPRILIVCEGAKTEPNYFESFRISGATVKVEGTGRNTKSLVEETMELRGDKKNYNQVWCVFDLDSFPHSDFDEAIVMANKNGMKVAYSNVAFEIWYLLHFDYPQAAMDRDQYKDILTTKLHKKYKKNDEDIYHDLFNKQNVALTNAKRLLSEDHESHINCSKKNPSTTVHELVIELNKYVR